MMMSFTYMSLLFFFMIIYTGFQSVDKINKRQSADKIKKTKRRSKKKEELSMWIQSNVSELLTTMLNVYVMNVFG